MTTVAVTGATGFIGTHLVHALVARGVNVVAVARAPRDDDQSHELAVSRVRAELVDEEALAEAFRGCDAVLHLAGGGTADQRATWETNAEGTRHVVAACRRAGVGRMMLASTVTVTRTRVSAYGASKRDAEREVLESGLDATIFRFAFVYGLGRTGVFARLVELARCLPVVPVIGTGELDIAPVYVDDVVDAIVAALQRPEISAGKIYTLAGPPATFDEVVDGVLQHLGSSKPKLHIPGWAALALARVLSRLSDPPITCDNVLGMIQEADHNSSLARADLDFSPRPLRQGLDATFADQS
jgi:nucleoside-diphosphate-sugar epimerase